jgi:anti-sigma factor RsiW
MNCNDAQNLIQAYADTELDPASSLEMERHLRSCPACTQMLENILTLRTALKAEAGYHKPGPELTSRIHAALQKAGGAQPGLHRAQRRTWLGAGAALAAVVVLAWTIVPLLSGRSADDLMVREAVADHVRSLMADHLTDVMSSDQHTVKPWFSGKLDFSPPVENFVAQGYTLVGGRLDYLGNRPVAGLVYRHRQHYINVFVWPADAGSATNPKELSRQGYQIMHWTQSGMHYWVVSELNQDELRQFARLIQHLP